MEWRNIASDYGASANYSTITDGNSRQDNHIICNPDIITNHYRPLNR